MDALATGKIFMEIIEWADDSEGWLGNLFTIACWVLIGYPGAWLAFTHITGVGL